MTGMLEDVRAHEVSPAFVGREPELTTLTDAFERARAGDPGAVLLGGEAERRQDPRGRRVRPTRAE